MTRIVNLRHPHACPAPIRPRHEEAPGSHSRSRDGEVRPKRHATTVRARRGGVGVAVHARDSDRAVLRDLAGLRTRLGLLASAPSRQNSGRLACRAASTRAFVAERGGRHAHAHTRNRLRRVARRTPSALPRRHTGASAPPPDADKMRLGGLRDIRGTPSPTRAGTFFHQRAHQKVVFFFLTRVSDRRPSAPRRHRDARVHQGAASDSMRPSPPRKGPARRSRARELDGAGELDPESRAGASRLDAMTVRRATSRTKVPWSCSCGRGWTMVSDATVVCTLVLRRIFDTLLDVVKKTTCPRSASPAGWMRDKLLGKHSSDIDIALDGAFPSEFALKVNEYLSSMAYGVARPNRREEDPGPRLVTRRRSSRSA